MKASEVEWIGEIPKGWSCEPIKYLASIIQGSTPDTSDWNNWSDDPDGIIWVTPADMADDGLLSDSTRRVSKRGYESCGTTLLPLGSTVISTRAPIGKVNFTTVPLCTNQGCKSLITNGMDSEYLYWAVLASKSELVRAGRGTTFMELSAAGLGGIYVPVPPSNQQRAISKVLKTRVTQLDKAIDAITRQLDVLGGYRKSLIQETVTRGLDPDATMRPSGIDWIGDIPAHWQTDKLRYICSRIFDGPFGSNLTGDDYSDEGVRVVRLENLKYLEFDDSKKSYVSEEKYRSLSANTVYPSDLIMATFVQDEMDVCILPGYIGYAVNKSDCVGIRLLGSIANRDYFHYFLSTDFVWQYLRSMLHGATRSRVNTNQIKQIPVLLPPLDEQRAIAAHLDAKASTIDRIAAVKRMQLDNLRVQRQSIIYEYVTGKRRVV